MLAFAPVAATALHFGIIEVLIASAWCFGFWKAFDSGMILHPVDRWARGYAKGTMENIGYVKGKMPAWLYKPLMGCVICMASIHGSLFYWLVIGLDWQVILFIVCLSGSNFLLSQIVRE